MVRDTTLYDRLEVQPDASAADILKSYKLLAKKYHPDKNPDDPNANVKLQEINQAKEFLTNPEKRQMYDQLGMDFVNGNQPQQAVRPEDLFRGFPGHPFGNMRGQQQKENVEIHQEVTLEQIYNEATIQISFQQKQVCGVCKAEFTKCDTCDGRGFRVQVVQMGPMIQQIQTPCNTCNSTGKKENPNGKCSGCDGSGYKLKDVKANIPLKNGLSNGQKIQIPNHGHHLRDGKTDLIIVIHEKPHNVYKRINNDLLIEVDLKLFQAISGFDKIIEHLDGRKLHISHTGKTEHGSFRKISDEGMKVLNGGSKGKGDLIIKFNIKLPNLDDSEISNKLLYLLKTIDSEESNKETIIKNSKNNYVKTILMNVEGNPTEPQQQFHEMPRGVHEPQCVQS
jgi:DnaJ-class molecular chaperone